jgi:hypothetical protein
MVPFFVQGEIKKHLLIRNCLNVAKVDLTFLLYSESIAMEVFEKILGMFLVISISAASIYYRQWRFEKRYKEFSSFKYKKRIGYQK